MSKHGDYRIIGHIKSALDIFTKEMRTILKDINLQSIIGEDVIIEHAMKKVFGDLTAFVGGDPSVHGSDEIAIETTGFTAVRHYRYLNSIYTLYKEYFEEVDDEDNEYLMTMILQKIRKHSEDIKTRTKVEIHPQCTIGENFVIDHGTDTVIGERTTIGNNCRILNDVILGSSLDNSVEIEKRHPTIMDNVEIYSGARILGNITIGNNCVIGTKCIIKRDVPDNSVVSVINQLQVSKKKKNKHNPIIYGIIPQNNDILFIYGKNLICDNDLKIDIIVPENHEKKDIAKIHIEERTSNILKLKIASTSNLKNYGLRIYNSDDEIIIKECIAMSEIGGSI